MKRTVQLSLHSKSDCLVTFKEGRKKIAAFSFWNFHGYGDVLARSSVDFIKHGILPKEANGLIKI